MESNWGYGTVAAVETSSGDGCAAIETAETGCGDACVANTAVEECRADG